MFGCEHILESAMQSSLTLLGPLAHRDVRSKGWACVPCAHVLWLMQCSKRSAGTWTSAPLPGWPPFHHPSWSEDISMKELPMKLCTRLLLEWSAKEEDKHF